MTMIDASELIAELSQQYRRYTAPLFLQDYFLRSGHDDRTHNGTATFIKFDGHHYVCTCRHVAKSVGNGVVMGADTNHSTAALMVGRVVINLSFFTADGLRSALRGPTVDDGYEIDVCICEIDSHWELLQAHKDKEAIDLDEWTEPPWQETRMCAAVGYADEHKTTQGGQVATPMPVVIAELQSKLSAEAREFTLSSTLDEPHGMHFSGMSGGPIIGLWGEADYKPIGLIFEGYPSSGDAPASELVGPNDILVRGLLLTPERFNSWLLAITPA